MQPSLLLAIALQPVACAPEPTVPAILIDEGDPVPEIPFQQDLDALCLPDGRRVGTEGHAAAVVHLQRRMTELGLAPYRGSSFSHTYTGNDETLENLIGVLRGADRAAPPLLIGAHYDSVIDAPCADDNAAAVAIALEAIERLAAAPIAERPRDVVLALFDAEEPPWFQTDLMGCVRFHDDVADERGFHAVLVLDLVGHDVPLPGLADVLFVTGAESHPELVGVVDRRRGGDGLRIVAAHNDYPGDMSDHGVFRQNGVPFLFLSCGRWEHYHRETDTVEKLNRDKMARIRDWLIEATRAVAAAPLERGKRDGDFSLALELATMNDALQQIPEPLRESLGIALPLATRAQLDRVAEGLLAMGL